MDFSTIINTVIIIVLLFLFYLLNKWYNKRFGVPKIFSLFPMKFGVRKVNEHLAQLNPELAKQGVGIQVTYYAVDLFFVTIPLKVSKHKNK